MRNFTGPTILPVFLFLFLSAEECNYDTVSEQVTVRPDGGVEVVFQHTAKTMDRVLDADPSPSVRAGWDSVHVGLGRENKEDLYFLRAWNEFPAGADLPGSYADPEDPLSEWYVQFPSELVREELGDTVFFRYERTYPALPWNPKALFEGFEEEMNAAEEALDALEELDQGDFQEKWEDSGALEGAKEEGDSAVLRQYQREFKELLSQGSPSAMDLYQQYFSAWQKASLLSDLAFAIPLGERFCRKSQPRPRELAVDLVIRILERSPLPEEHIIMALLAGEDIEPDPTVFPGVVPGEFDPWDDAVSEDLEVEALEAVKDGFRRECQLSSAGLIEFDRRLAWLNELYRIADLEIRKQMFGFYLLMPGELLETNADTVVDGRAEWGFDIRELFEGDVTVKATSRLVRGDPNG
jgi:hypothetical protein